MSSTILGIIASSGGAAASTSSYESIASATGTGSSITFSSIPSTYKHLQIRFIGRNSFVTSGIDADLYVVVNGDTGTNYAQHTLWGTGAAVSSNAQAPSIDAPYLRRAITYNGETSGLFGVGIIDIHDYASTTKTKVFRSFHGQDRNGSGTVVMQSILWNSTSAITSISLTTGGSDTFVSGSTFALYGIKG
jgi:hypothetical protein